MNNRRISSSEFIKAAQKGDMTVIEPYVAKNGSNPGAINATDQDGNTALCCAAYNNHTAIVQTLLTAPSINLDAANQSGCTALYYATLKGHTAIVQALIDAKAKIEMTNKHGGTALMYAAQNGHTVIVQALIDAGAKIDTTSQNGYTALMLAASRGHTAAVQTLINAGAKINLTRLKINLLNAANHTALTLAAYNGHAATVQALIDAGAEIHQYTIDASYQFNSNERKAAKILITAKINNIHKQRLANGNKPEDIINAFNEQTKYEYYFLGHIYRELFNSYAYDYVNNSTLKKLMLLAKHLYKGLGYDPVEAIRFLTNDFAAMPDDAKALASDLLAYFNRKKKPSIYISAIEQELNELKNDIASAQFYVKDIKGNWVPGKPRHIATIESIVKQQRKTWADTLGAYSKVMTLLDTEASIFQKSRHQNTTLFYKDSLEKLRGIRYDGSNSYTPMPPSYEDHMKMYPASYAECMQSNPASAAAADLAYLPPTYTNITTPAAAAAAPSPAPAVTYSTQTFAAMFPPVPTDALPDLPSERPAEKRMLSA